MKKYVMGIAALMICLVVTGCSNSAEIVAGNVTSADETDTAQTSTETTTTQTSAETTAAQSGTQQENIITVGYADFTHNGVQEKIVVDASEIDTVGTQEATLKIYSSENDQIWEETAGISHCAWNSLYLCSIDGKDYLLRYNPYACTGGADYHYELFWIDEAGNTVNVCSHAICFGISDPYSGFDISELVSFYDEINTYLSQSTLLLSTEGGDLAYGTETNKLTRTEEYSWLSDNTLIAYGKNDTLKDKLEKYQEYLNEMKSLYDSYSNS